jgi:hypothetical protein
MMRTAALSAAMLASLVAAACGGRGGGPPRPDLVCPGDTSCPDEGEAVLYAGAAWRDGTPAIVA